MKRLLFIDTNILLDFYRSRTEAGLSLLNHVDTISKSIVMTHQVEMEFKKNRQSAILESLSLLKPPGMVTRPGLFSEAKEVKALQRDFRNAAKRITALRGRLKNVFTKPTTHDPVYKVVQRIFSKQGELNLTRQNTLNGLIRRRAYRRFILGFPPRKQADTSLGDAVNWEWMVHCATEAKAELTIVSRDSDYGVTFESKTFLNDWLLQEFRDRVSKKRNIVLFTRLSEALRLLKVEVSEAEQREEEELAKPILTGADYYKYIAAVDPKWPKYSEEVLKAIQSESLAALWGATTWPGNDPSREQK